MNPEELLEIAERIVGWGRDGEQIEAVVGHSQETEVRVYEGEIESLSVAESQGVGIRVIADDRQGFAHAGTLDPEVLEETLAEARDNTVFGSPDEFFGLAEPDGVEPPELDLYNEALLEFGTDAKIDMALELERAVQAGDPRIVGVESADYGDAVGADAIATTTGIRSTGRDTSCYLTAYSLALENDETQTGFGFSVGREPGSLNVAEAATDAVERATPHAGRVPTPHRAGHRGARPLRDRPVPGHHRRNPVGRGRAQGPLAVRRPPGRPGGRRGRHPG